MKILTNIRFVQTAGIAQVLTSFLDFIRENKKGFLDVVGVNVSDSSKPIYKKKKRGNVSLVSIGVKVPAIKDAVADAKNLEDVKIRYADVINAYRKVIKREKPDLVLVNGTYYIPWCLFIAARRESVPVVLHYHGVLTMETKRWPLKQRRLFKKMEQSFDAKEVFYIFPSNITKKVVENGIYGHKVKNSAIIPNPVPLHFFDNNKTDDKTNIGIICRWTSIKNIDFCEALARYNKERKNKFTINLITDIDKGDKRHKKLSKLIKIWPERKNEKLVSFYSNMGIVISPSHFETYGNVAKEALASGIPAIVSRNMGVSETFKKVGLKKWVIDFKSVKDVYRKIEKNIGMGVEEDIRSKLKESYHPQKIFNEIVNILIFRSEIAN